MVGVGVLGSSVGVAGICGLVAPIVGGLAAAMLSRPVAGTWARPCLRAARNFAHSTKPEKARPGGGHMLRQMPLTNVEQLDKPKWLRFLPPNAKDKWREDFTEAVR